MSLLQNQSAQGLGVRWSDLATQGSQSAKRVLFIVVLLGTCAVISGALSCGAR